MVQWNGLGSFDLQLNDLAGHVLTHQCRLTLPNHLEWELYVWLHFLMNWLATFLDPDIKAATILVHFTFKNYELGPPGKKRTQFQHKFQG